jgi:hypothetical protein
VSSAQIAALAGLGAFHGLNPAMGWLFAVARGMQERSRAVLLRSLPPIAAGHLASVAMAVCAVVVYAFVGVAVLRRAWFNVDRLWAAVLLGAGALTIALAA